jgi:hypothetical protein
VQHLQSGDVVLGDGDPLRLRDGEQLLLGKALVPIMDQTGEIAFGLVEPVYTCKTTGGVRDAVGVGDTVIVQTALERWLHQLDEFFISHIP